MFLQLDDTLSFGEYEVHASGCHQHPSDIICVHREQDYLGLRHDAFEDGRRFRPAQQWHGKVEQNQIRLKLSCFFYGIRAIFRLPANCELGSGLHERAEQKADASVIVSDEDSRHGNHATLPNLCKVGIHESL